MPTLYVTAPPEAAESLSRTLVEERLAACVTRVACDSVYRWNGEVHDEEEVILFVKTRSDVVADCEARIEERHPYDVPCIERFEEDDLLAAFREWRDGAVDPVD